LTNSNYTHIATVVDRSGSMFAIAEDMRGALDSYFFEQAKVPGKCLVDYVQFDNKPELVFEDKFITEAEAVLAPRGSTALLDAIGFTVTRLGEKLAKLSEDQRPSLVQVVVVTDGHENASRDWTASAIKDLIKEQEDKYSWDFVFLGANMDAVAVGESFGFNSGKSMTYDVHNTSAMAQSLAGYTTRSRLVGQASNSFTSDERDAQKS